MNCLKFFVKVLLLIVPIYIFNVELAVTYADENKAQFIWPVSGQISDYFGTRNGQHRGVDIAASDGASVLAAHSGKVVKSYCSKSYGNVIFIVNADGYETVYAHLSKRLVNINDFVEQGELIGLVGNTGHSTGPHLHFEIHKGSWNITKSHSIDPLTVLEDIPALHVSK